eukprot:1827259-Alexandrium_andersonii.AAC.1
MSASLVGSEMCIRDSPEAGTRGANPPPPICASCQEESAEDRSKKWGREPVSYTHLTLPTICSV